MTELQGTVAAYDEATRDARVLLDDGTSRDVPGAAVRPEVLRLRPGQRVRLTAEGPVVTALTLVGMPL